jgi:hypothetical protein
MHVIFCIFTLHFLTHVDTKIFPGLCGEPEEECKVNFGQQPLKYLPSGYLPVMECPVLSRQFHSFDTSNMTTVVKNIIDREFSFGGCKNVEQIKTHAFLSHKRSSAQGIAGTKIFY